VVPPSSAPQRGLCRVPVVERWVEVKMVKRGRLVAMVQGMVEEKLVMWQAEIWPQVCLVVDRDWAEEVVEEDVEEVVEEVVEEEGEKVG